MKLVYLPRKQRIHQEVNIIAHVHHVEVLIGFVYGLTQLQKVDIGAGGVM